MSLYFTNAGINTNPKTDSQMRNTLARLAAQAKRNRVDLSDANDTLSVILEAFQQISEADSDISLGQVVYVSSDGHVDLAQADSAATTFAKGLALQNAASGSPCKWAPFGVVTNDNWTLMPDHEYFLSAVTAGALVATPDSDTAGDYVIIVGVAITPTKLFVNIQQPILL